MLQADEPMPKAFAGSPRGSTSTTLVPAFTAAPVCMMSVSRKSLREKMCKLGLQAHGSDEQ